MIEKIILSGSIVLYNENLKELKNTIDCFLSAKFTKKLFLIDNTPDSRFKGTFTHTDIVYFEVGKNIGFGRGHNLVLDKIKNHSTYHLVLNPDVSFKASILNKLIEQLQTDASLAMVAPKVLFPDNAPQYSCRRYPSVLELIIRRVFFLRPMFRTLLNKGTYKDKNLNFPFYAEYLTGCFQFYNTKDFIAINGFDNRFFLYMEDVDICRKIDAFGKKKLYFPEVTIFHSLKQASSKEVHLFFRHSISAVKYFFKWGL